MSMYKLMIDRPRILLLWDFEFFTAHWTSYWEFLSLNQHCPTVEAEPDVALPAMLESPTDRFTTSIAGSC